MVIDRAVCHDCDIKMEATFELSPLAALDEFDQVFVTEFLKCHGSIKHLQRVFGISYPTVKNRLSNLARQLTETSDDHLQVVSTANVNGVLDRVRKQELTVDEAIQRLRQ